MSNCCNFYPDPATDPDFMDLSILTWALMAKTQIFTIAPECCQFCLKSHWQLKVHAMALCQAKNDPDQDHDPDLVRL